MFIAKVFSLFFVCLLAYCGNSVSQNESLDQSQPSDKIELSLSMERTACFGTCPVYKLNIEPNGKVLFEGIRFTKTEGKIESAINEEKINRLIDEINKADFFSLKDSYTSSIDNCPDTVTDSESVILHIKLKGKEKTINHYLGCWESDRPNENDPALTNWSPKVVPQQLYLLENKIDEIVGTQKWIGEQK